MSHRIKIYKNFISDYSCSTFIDQFNLSQLELFEDNPNIKIINSEYTKETINILSEKIKILVKRDFGFLRELELQKGYFTLWEPGSEAGLHIDSHAGSENVIFSFVIYFNSNFGGGEIYFPYQEFTHSPEAGDLVLFPSGGKEYAHQVNQIQNENRYTIAGWYIQKGSLPRLEVIQ
jgi:Rps23 Pro-64 3,4-dihydroxylase Tpa1-like proline 4-hydroxylase